MTVTIFDWTPKLGGRQTLLLEPYRATVRHAFGIDTHRGLEWWVKRNNVEIAHGFVPLHQVFPWEDARLNCEMIIVKAFGEYMPDQQREGGAA